MKVGIRLPQTGKQAKLENIIYLVEAAEEIGFDSLWVLERLLWPTSPLTKYPPSPTGEFPPDWQNVLDPLELLSFVAAKTTKIFLGTSVIDMLFHNPIILAKRFATLDLLSNGRTLAGLGIGWSKDEFLVSNIPLVERGSRADEFLELLKLIWTEDTIEFKGRFYNVPFCKIGPKPVQKPFIPLLLGGSNPNTFSRMAKYATGWIGVVRNNLDQLENTLDILKVKVIEAKRDPDEFELIVIVYPNLQKLDTDKGRRLAFTGAIEQIGSDIEKLKKMGIAHIILNFNRSQIEDDIKAIIEASNQILIYSK